MKIVILADIHSNWEALNEVAKYLNEHPYDKIIDLGDVIGYGASPNECYEWVKKNAFKRIMGNHEQAVFDHKLRHRFSPQAFDAIEWTETKMSKEYVQDVKSLKHVDQDEELDFVHGSLETPERFLYLKSYEDARPCFQMMMSMICFIGHTHVPGYFSEKDESHTYLKEGKVSLDRNSKYLLNPGSVGQPRDGDKRASFGIFDTEEWSFEVIRLEYPKDIAAQKIREAGLPTYLADRLL